MIDQHPVQADGAGTLDESELEQGGYGAGETGGGKPADGIHGEPGIEKRDEGGIADDSVMPDEDPQMGIAISNG